MIGSHSLRHRLLQGRSYHWGLGGPRPPPNRFGPPTNDLGYCTVQYSLIAIAKILLLDAVNRRFDSYAKMYFVGVALQFYTYISRENSDRGINH